MSGELCILHEPAETWHWPGLIDRLKWQPKAEINPGILNGSYRFIESQGAITVVQPDAGVTGIRLLYTAVFSGYPPQFPM